MSQLNGGKITTKRDFNVQTNAFYRLLWILQFNQAQKFS